MKKNSFFLQTFIVLILSLLFLSHSYAQEVILDATDEVSILWNSDGSMTYQNGTFSHVLAEEIYSQLDAQVLLFEDGNKVIYVAQEDIQKVKVYNFLNQKTYDVSPHNYIKEQDIDFHHFLPQYSDFLVSPSGSLLHIKTNFTEFNDPNFVIYDLEELTAFLNSKSGQEGNVELFETYEQASDIVVDHTYYGDQSLWGKGNMHDFSWNEDGGYQFNVTQDYGYLVEFDDVVLIADIYEGNSETREVSKVGIYPPSPFSDLPETDPDYAEVLRAVQAGWLEGYPDGTVRLDSPVNRAELSKIAIKALEIPEEMTELDESVCPDVPAGEWYTNTFKTAKVHGAIQGYPEVGVPQSQWLCKPDQFINKVESLKIMMELAGWNQEAFGFDETYTNQYTDTDNIQEWYWFYTGFSKYFNLIRSEDGNLYPGNDMTRREMIYLTNHILDIFGVWKDGI